jgi:2-keto-3-deoxy-L-arabinonate dehydratase
MQLELDGAVPVLPVPFLEDESIDEASLREVVDFTVARQIKALCIPAYASEFYKLSDAEREAVIRITIDHADGRILVVAQANHPSARVAADLARRYEGMGADVIGFALPRQFATTDPDLLAYCGRIADAVSCPILVQDFNPGGPTIDAEFIAAANERHPNITYFKLEEPMIYDKLNRIREVMGPRAGILGGWGGYYMLESVSAGVCGIMPGASICDLLDRVFRDQQRGDHQRAYELFSSVMPYIAFALQDFEMFLQIDKRLLVRRGVFKSPRCRSISRQISEGVSAHIDFLIDQVIRVISREQLDI